jgi:ribosomal protein S18 acetylase RimI-like enzyme
MNASIHHCPEDFDAKHMRIRLASDQDYGALREIFQESVIEGQVGDNDTGADIDNLRDGYFADEGQSCFWVADFQALVVGMVGVQRTNDNTAEIRRLRVRSAYRRRGVATLLMERAMSFCRTQGYLKVILDVRVERGPAIQMFEKFGFSHARTREISGRKLLDFYLDLYRDPHKPR